MNLLDKLNAAEAELKGKETPATVVDIPRVTLSAFERRDLAVEIYCEALGCTVWLCSNKEMASQVKRDDPEAVCYTTHELRELVKLNPGSEDLKKIHDAKSIFPGSTLKERIQSEVPEVIKG